MQTTSRAGRRRAAWLVLAAATGAFALFEAEKHGGGTPVAGLLGALVPFAARVLPAAAGRFLTHPAPPALLLVLLAVGPWTTVQVAPTFTAGLAWLAHVAVRRGLRGAADAGELSGR